MPPDDGGTFGCYLLFFLFSHCWFAMPQLVLQADWQDVWHSPQPPFLALSQRFFVSRVLMGFITLSSGFPYFRSDACAARYKHSKAQLYCITIRSACQYSFCGSRGFLRASLPSAYALRARAAHDAPNAAGRTAAAHPPRIVGRIPQRPRGIRGEAKSNAIFPPDSPKVSPSKDDAAGRKIAPKKARIIFEIAFPHTGDLRLGCSRAQSAEAIRPAALPHSQNAHPHKSQKPAASALIRRTDTRYSARQPER